MKRIIAALVLLVVSFSTGHLSPDFCQEEQKEKVWQGKSADGTVITEEDLRKILSDHKEWVECFEQAGKDACKHFGKADLSHTNLSEADLRNSTLIDTDLNATRIRESKTFGATYQTKPGALPFVSDIATVKGLETLRNESSPPGL